MSVSWRWDNNGAINYIVAYAPTKIITTAAKRPSWEQLDSRVERIPAREGVYVLMDANARARRRVEPQGNGVLGNFGRDELN